MAWTERSTLSGEFVALSKRPAKRKSGEKFKSTRIERSRPPEKAAKHNRWERRHPMPKQNDLEGRQDMGGKHGGQVGVPKPEGVSGAQQGIVKDEKGQEHPADKARA